MLNLFFSTCMHAMHLDEHTDTQDQQIHTHIQPHLHRYTQRFKREKVYSTRTRLFKFINRVIFILPPQKFNMFDRLKNVLLFIVLRCQIQCCLL